jgi:hypothetical protein
VGGGAIDDPELPVGPLSSGVPDEALEDPARLMARRIRMMQLTINQGQKMSRITSR